MQILPQISSGALKTIQIFEKVEYDTSKNPQKFFDFDGTDQNSKSAEFCGYFHQGSNRGGVTWGCVFFSKKFWKNVSFFTRFFGPFLKN